MIKVTKAVFPEGNKYYPQIYLHECMKNLRLSYKGYIILVKCT